MPKQTHFFLPPVFVSSLLSILTDCTGSLWWFIDYGLKSGKQIAIFVLNMPQRARTFISCRTTLSVTTLISHCISFCHCHIVTVVGDVVSRSCQI